MEHDINLLAYVVDAGGMLYLFVNIRDHWSYGHRPEFSACITRYYRHKIGSHGERIDIFGIEVI